MRQGKHISYLPDCLRCLSGHARLNLKDDGGKGLDLLRRLMPTAPRRYPRLYAQLEFEWSHPYVSATLMADVGSSPGKVHDDEREIRMYGISSLPNAC